jgi:pimeloyl-ACP methyl ester carboxylesterase
MTPFFFGSGQRRLFGIYTPGHGSGHARAAVFCHPWGQEYLRAHRSMRHLASLLNRAGVHVLRFDYFGSGDSAGDGLEADLAGWEGDVETAIDELKDTASVERVGLVGLRLGANLAASVAARRRDDVDALVLWDPVVDGGEYIREIERVAPQAGPQAPGAPRDVFGFVLTEAMARSFQSLDLLGQVASLPARTTVVTTESLPSHVALQAALTDRPAGALAVELIPSPPAWYEDRNTGVGAMPVKVLQRIVQLWG